MTDPLIPFRVFKRFASQEEIEREGNSRRNAERLKREITAEVHGDVHDLSKGHLWDFSVHCRPSYSIEGIEGHIESDITHTLHVSQRAWSLPEALAKLLARPLTDWEGFGE